MILSRFVKEQTKLNLRLATGVRGALPSNTKLTFHSEPETYSQDDEIYLGNSQDKTLFEPERSSVRITLFGGPIYDTLALRSYDKSLEWKRFLDQTYYRDDLFFQYLHDRNTPRATVFNEKDNRILTFYCVRQLHNYINESGIL